jgi:hypothetical protein
MQSARHQRVTRLQGAVSSLRKPFAPARLPIRASKPAFVARVASAEAFSTATTPVQRKDERGFALNEVRSLAFGKPIAMLDWLDSALCPALAPHG